jgi:hypothetical protein
VLGSILKPTRARPIAGEVARSASLRGELPDRNSGCLAFQEAVARSLCGRDAVGVDDLGPSKGLERADGVAAGLTQAFAANLKISEPSHRLTRSGFRNTKDRFLRPARSIGYQFL